MHTGNPCASPADAGEADSKNRRPTVNPFRLLAFLAGIILLLPWMTMKMMAYTAAILGDLPRFAR